MHASCCGWEMLIGLTPGVKNLCTFTISSKVFRGQTVITLSCNALPDFQKNGPLELLSPLTFASETWAIASPHMRMCLRWRRYPSVCACTCVLMCCSGAVTRLAQLSHNMTMMDRKRQAAKIHRGRPERLESERIKHSKDKSSGMRRERAGNWETTH